MNRLDLRLLVIEALDELSSKLEGDDCVSEEEDEVEEQSVTSGGMGYTLPLGASNSGGRHKSILDIGHRSFGGSRKK